MKLINKLFASQVLNRGVVRHFSDGDFAVALERGSSYVDSIRLPRRCRWSGGAKVVEGRSVLSRGGMRRNGGGFPQFTGS